MSAADRRKWPVIIQRGGASVKIYRGTRKKKSEQAGSVILRKYTEYRVAYYDEHGRRKFEGFSEFDAASRRAQEVIAMPTRGDGKLLVLTAEDRELFIRARAALEGVSVPLDVAAVEYAQAHKITGGRVIEAARHFESIRAIKERTVEQAVSEFITSREQAAKGGKPASAAYLHDLETRLRPLGESFSKPIHKIGADEIREYVDALKLAARSRHNLLRLVRTLFRFAQARRYYPRDINPMEGIDLSFSHEGATEVFTPDELRRLLRAAKTGNPELLPFLVIGAFAGLRSAEISRLEWGTVGTDYIKVTAEKAKTRSRRLVPIQPNLAEWLATFTRGDGTVVEREVINHGFRLLTAATKTKDQGPVVWKTNGLRHSYITYRLAITNDEGRTAAEAGNSPNIIHKHYRATDLKATETVAKEWFNIKPADC